MLNAQLGIHISMIKKWLIFLVVPSLDFMLRVKLSQKLSLPSVPNFNKVRTKDTCGGGLFGREGIFRIRGYLLRFQLFYTLSELT